MNYDKRYTKQVQKVSELVDSNIVIPEGKVYREYRGELEKVRKDVEDNINQQLNNLMKEYKIWAGIIRDKELGVYRVHLMVDSYESEYP